MRYERRRNRGDRFRNGRHGIRHTTGGRQTAAPCSTIAPGPGGIPPVLAAWRTAALGDGQRGVILTGHGVGPSEKDRALRMGHGLDCRGTIQHGEDTKDGEAGGRPRLAPSVVLRGVLPASPCCNVEAGSRAGPPSLLPGHCAPKYLGSHGAWGVTACENPRGALLGHGSRHVKNAGGGEPGPGGSDSGVSRSGPAGRMGGQDVNIIRTKRRERQRKPHGNRTRPACGFACPGRFQPALDEAAA